MPRIAKPVYPPTAVGIPHTVPLFLGRTQVAGHDPKVFRRLWSPLFERPTWRSVGRDPASGVLDLREPPLSRPVGGPCSTSAQPRTSRQLTGAREPTPTDQALAAEPK